MNNFEFDNTGRINKWLLRILIGLAVILVAALAISEARAQMRPCFALPDMLKILSEKYKEAPVASGLLSQTTILRVFRSKDGETFTVITVNTAGVACIMAAGQFWTEQEFVATGAPA